jgi:acyl-coenzyme A synthetase/AMP-(fatty) acid ligase
MARRAAETAGVELAEHWARDRGAADTTVQYIFFTGGTGGAPRAVALAAAPALAGATRLGERAGVVGGLDVGAVTSPLWHISGLATHLLMPMTLGAAVVLPAGLGALDSFDATVVLACVQAEGVTLLQTQPHQLAALARTPPALRASHLLTACKGVSFGLAVAGAAHVPERALAVPAYGLTETAAACFSGTVEHPPLLKAASVGQPLVRQP